jgi:hypothetical protein
MKKILILSFTVFLVLGCAATLPKMEEPAEGKNLIIGSVIFENNGYQDRNDVYFDNIEVAIIGIYKDNGKEKIFGKWIRTDKNGYFFIPNVPDGRYALKGLRINMSGQAFLTIVNEFRTLVDNYKIWPTENITFSGEYFNTKPQNRIVNLKHNYFTFFQNREIRYGAYDKIDQFQASNGDVITRPMIFKYFIENYPQSGWNKYLQKILDTYEY